MRGVSATKRALHRCVVGSSSTFGGNPGYVLAGIFNIAGLTVNAVLGIDLKTLACRVLYDFIYPRRAVSLRGLAPAGQICFER